jgi:hypothetical protein
MKLFGLKLVTALTRTSYVIPVMRDGVVTHSLTSQEALELAAGPDSYYGSGSKRRIKALIFQPPVHIVPAILPPKLMDSGFSLLPYQCRDQSSTPGKVINIGWPALDAVA